MKHVHGLVVLTAIVIGGCYVPPKPVAFYELEVEPEAVFEVEPLDLEAPPEEPDVVPEEPEVFPEAVELSLEECRVWTLENNLDLQAQLLDPTIQSQALRAAEAKFESVFYSGVNWSKTDNPLISDLLVQGTMEENVGVNAGVEIPLRTGGTVKVDFTDFRGKTDRFVLLNPYYTNGLDVSISQPLLRNAGRRVNMHSIRIERYNLRISEAQTKLELIRVLTAVDRAYWRLVAARKELEVRQQQYELAQAQLERARRLVDAGQRPEVEVLRAEAGIAAQLEQIIIAENALRDRQREMKKIMNRQGLPVFSPTRLVPVTELDPVPYELEPEVMVVRAMENRMELLEAELQIAKQVSNIDYLHNQALPLVNVGYTYNINALGDSRSNSFEMLQDKNFEDHRLGVELVVPLGNEVAKGRLWQAFYARMQLLSVKENQEDLIELEVLQVVDQVQANWQRILAARQAVLLEARLTEAEIRQFEIGMRTSTDVLEAQTRLTEARSAEIRALAEYQVSLVDLAYATGTVLGAAKVEWEPIAARPVEAGYN